MIKIRYQVLGGHTHLVVRTGNPEAAMALCGRLIMDNDDASILIRALEAHRLGGISVLEGGDQ